MLFIDGVLLFYVLPALITTFIAIQVRRYNYPNLSKWTDDHWEVMIATGMVYPIIIFFLIGYILMTYATNEIPFPWSKPK